MKLNPALSLKLMRRVGHKIDDCKRAIPESKWYIDPVMLELKVRLEKSIQAFLRHTAKMNVHELHAMTTDKNLVDRY